MKTLINIALSQYGVREKIGPTHNPVILKYFKTIGHQWVTSDETAWCSAFLNWVAHTAGQKGSNALTARSWLHVGQIIHLPKLNDIVIFWRESPSSWKGHVGLFIGYTEDKDHIYVLGGNQNNEVNIKTYPVKRLLGFRRLEER